jgi:hypothetical protein
MEATLSAPPEASAPPLGATLAEARELARQLLFTRAEKARRERPAEPEFEPPPAPRRRPAPPDAPAAAHEFPAERFYGIRDLSLKLNDTRPATTFTVAIGVHPVQGLGRSQDSIGNRLLRTAVGERVRSMVRPGDFGCRISPDVYLMVISNSDSDPADQAIQIEQRLRRFELEVCGEPFGLFSLASAQSDDQPLAETVRIAIERLRRRVRSAGSVDLTSLARPA